MRKTLKEVQVHKNQVLEKYVCQSYEKIVETVEVEVDYQLIQAKLQELQMEIEEDEEDAETLSQ